MAADFSSGALSRFRLVLHDDNHLSDHRFIKNGTFFVPDPAGNILYSVHPAFAPGIRRVRHLLFTARSRCTYRHYLRLFDKADEAVGNKKDGGEYA